MSYKMGGITAALLKQVGKEEVSCPKPRHAAPWIYPEALEMLRPVKQLTGGNAVLLPEGDEAGYEILEILSKKDCRDVCVSGSPIPFFYGSPPTRASNPLVNDVQFIQKKEMPLPSYLGKKLACHSGGSASLKKPSCGTTYGLKPCERIEGFLSSNSDAHRNVLAFA